MMILPYIVLALAALIALLVIGVLFAQAEGRVDVALRVQALDIAPEHKLMAMACFDRADKLSPLSRTLWDKVRAPFVLFGPLRKLPFDADELPEELKYWRNNKSPNGDAYFWYDNDTGKWICTNDRKEPPGVEALRYGDMRLAHEDVVAYYVKGWPWGVIRKLFGLSGHPRGWYARWVWLAWRNVASQRDVELGEDVIERPIVLASSEPGSVPRLGDVAGWVLLWDGGDCYQFRSVQKIGPFALWRNVGYKLDILRATESGVGRASVIATWASFRRWG